MNNKEILKRLQPVFRYLFDDDITVTADTAAKDIEEWDPLAHMKLISAVEIEHKT